MRAPKTLITMAMLCGLGAPALAAQHERHGPAERHAPESGEAMTLDQFAELLGLSEAQTRAVEPDFLIIRAEVIKLSDLLERAEHSSAHSETHETMQAAESRIHEAHDRILEHLDDRQGELFSETLHEHLKRLHDGTHRHR